MELLTRLESAKSIHLYLPPNGKDAVVRCRVNSLSFDSLSLAKIILIALFICLSSLIYHCLDRHDLIWRYRRVGAYDSDLPLTVYHALLGIVRIIYDAIEEIQTAMKGMLAPKYREIMLGKAEVRMTYKITGVGPVAGCYVLDGKLQRNSMIRVVRDGIIVADDKIAGLKRFKDDAKDVAQGFECGVSLEKFGDIKEGDIFECYFMDEYRD